MCWSIIIVISLLVQINTLRVRLLFDWFRNLGYMLHFYVNVFIFSTMRNQNAQHFTQFTNYLWSDNRRERLDWMESQVHLNGKQFLCEIDFLHHQCFKAYNAWKKECQYCHSKWFQHKHELNNKINLWTSRSAFRAESKVSHIATKKKHTHTQLQHTCLLTEYIATIRIDDAKEEKQNNAAFNVYTNSHCGHTSLPTLNAHLWQWWRSCRHFHKNSHKQPNRYRCILLDNDDDDDDDDRPNDLNEAHKNRFIFSQVRVKCSEPSHRSTSRLQ